MIFVQKNPSLPMITGILHVLNNRVRINFFDY